MKIDLSIDEILTIKDALLMHAGLTMFKSLKQDDMNLISKFDDLIDNQL